MGFYMFRFVALLLEFLSGEYLMTRLRQANGGTVVFLRAGQVAVIGFFLGIGLVNGIDPDRFGGASWAEFRRQVVNNGQWFGALFGSAYAAFYARFASQWSYLAGVYNQIKSAQCRKDCSAEAIAEWRAGLIEDCDDLHLMRKEMFASIVNGLLNGTDEEAIAARRAFDRFSPGGVTRRERIAREASLVVNGRQRGS